MSLLYLSLVLFASLCFACNGDTRLCSRRYSALTLIGTHNSAFVGISPIHNQYISITQQLDLGVRFLQVQTHSLRGGIGLCHTTCWELHAGWLDGYLAEVAAWVDAHPADVVTLLLTNSDGISVERFGQAFRDARLDRHVYAPRGFVARDQWPTLGEFVEAGVRLVVFMALPPVAHEPAVLNQASRYADTSVVDYILPEFEYQWQNAFGETDSSFSNCSIDRPKNLAAQDAAAGYMYMINHFLDVQLPFGIKVPDQLRAAETNSLASITRQADLCTAQWGVAPNVILASRADRTRICLDWVNVGQAIEAQQLLNGLK